MSDDPGCGATEQGLCYGAAALMMVMLPLSPGGTTVAAALLAADAWRRARRKG